MPNEALEMLSLSSDSMISPGMMKAVSPTPSLSPMREPIAAPNTTKYSDVDSTGDAIDGVRVRKERAISTRLMARMAYQFMAGVLRRALPLPLHVAEMGGA